MLRGLGRALLRLPRFLPFLIAVAWMGFIWKLSSQSYGPGPGTLYWRALANLAHAPLFGLLTLFLAAGLLRPRAPARWPAVGPRQLVPIVALVGLYGVVDEWHQSRTPGRDASLMDIVVDLVGALCVMWVIAYLGRSEASERGLLARLASGVLLCVTAAVLGAVAG